MHFPAKQPCTNDTVCSAVMQHCMEKKWDIVIPVDLKRLFVSLLLHGACCYIYCI
jgi:hypothetical protein